MSSLLWIVLFVELLQLSYSFQRNSLASGWKCRTSQLMKSQVVPTISKVDLLHDNILVKIHQAKNSSVGGIFIPEQAKQKAHEGSTVSVGPGKYDDDIGGLLPMSAREGDFVVYGKYDGVEVKFDGIPHHIIKDNDVLLKVKSFNGLQEASETDIECIRDHLLIKLAIPDTTSPGGVIINSDASKRIDHGTVIKIGPGKYSKDGKKLQPVVALVGDSVKFREYAGTELKLQGMRYVVIKNNDLIAKL